MQRGVSRARAIGLEVELASPAETLRLLPQASPESLYGSVYMPGDGNLDPHSATYALAGAARELGAEIRTGERVTGIELGPRHEVRAVLTESGRIETEVVINAAGMWAPQVAALVGARLVSMPVEHQHIALAAVAGHELPRDLPCFRDPDYLVYGKSEAGGALFGGYEHDPAARWLDGVPWDHSGQTVPADEARFAPLMQGAAQPLPVPRRRGRRQARLPSRCHDARRQPARRRAARRARLLRRGRASRSTASAARAASARRWPSS